MAKSWFPEPFRTPRPPSPLTKMGGGGGSPPSTPGESGGGWGEKFLRTLWMVLPVAAVSVVLLALWTRERQTARGLESERAALVAETARLVKERDREAAARRLAQAEVRSRETREERDAETARLTGEVEALRARLEETRRLQEEADRRAEDLQARLAQRERYVYAAPPAPVYGAESGAPDDSAPSMAFNAELEAERRRSAFLEDQLREARNELDSRAAHWEADLDALRDSLLVLRDEVAVRDVRAREVVTVAHQEIQSVRDEVRSLEHEGESLRHRLREACDERDHLKSECSRLEHCVREAEQRIERQRHEIHQLQCQVKELVTQLKETVVALQAAQAAAQASHGKSG